MGIPLQHLAKQQVFGRLGWTVGPGNTTDGEGRND